MLPQNRLRSLDVVPLTRAAIGCVMPDKAALAEAFDTSEIFLERSQIFLNIVPTHILLSILMSRHDKV